MSEPNVSPHAAKVLADLLALTLADSGPEAESAVEAIRRRAARDGVTGGTIKALMQQLLLEVRPDDFERQPEDLQRSLADLHWTVEDQKRELEEIRHARQLTEHAMSDERITNAALADRIGGLIRARRNTGIMGFLLGIACTVGLYASGGLLHAIHIGPLRPNGVAGPQAHLNAPAVAQLGDYLRNCFLASTNSLGAGSSYDMHLVMDIGADGHIATVQAEPIAQQGDDDSGMRQYSDMMARTLNSGSCGKLPLPASLQGRTSHLDLRLPR